MAETHLRQAALAGYKPAIVALARLYGDGFEAAQWWRAAANAGDPEAQFAVAVRYARGEGVPQRLDAAARWFEKAAEQGHAAAQFNIGICRLTGSGVERDPALAAALVCPRRGAANGAGGDPPRAAAFYRRGGAAGPSQGRGMVAAPGGGRRQRGRNIACRSLPERQRGRARSRRSGTAASLRFRPRLRPGLVAARPSLRRRSSLAGEARGGDPLLSRRGRAGRAGGAIDRGAKPARRPLGRTQARRGCRVVSQGGGGRTCRGAIPARRDVRRRVGGSRPIRPPAPPGIAARRSRASEPRSTISR